MKSVFTKRNLIKFLSALVIISVPTFIFFRTQTYPQRIQIQGNVFDVEVADNPALMSKGLSGHAPLNDKQGMLFVFSSPGKHDFWMKDMTFPIDIIWFGADKRIVYMEKSLSPKTYPKTYSPSEPSLYVLEINSGLSDKLGLKIGDQFVFVKRDSINLGL